MQRGVGFFETKAFQTGVLVLGITLVVALADMSRHFAIHGTLAGNDPTSAVFISLLVATPISWVIVSQQINMRRAREELVTALEESRAALAVKTDFLANMTHELRTPLNAIIGFSGVLKDAPDLGPHHAHQVEIIWEGSQDLLRVVNDVLDFSRLEAGAVEFDAHAFDAAAMARSTVALLTDQAAAKGLAMSVVTEGLGDLLLGDEGRLRQVLMNFLSNAVKFTGAGQIEVSVSELEVGNQRHLRVAVTDSGIGIAPEQIGSVFDRFTQADASVSRRYGGTGLGLAISKRIVEGMGGRIGVQSAPSRGSTFWFEVTLPRATSAHSPVNPAPAPPRMDDRLQLLVVDDNAVNRELVCALLGPFDVQITTASDGVEAIAAVTENRFDVILMDVQMPNMDGLAATRHIRSAAKLGTPRVPIIAMTANVLPEQIQRCTEAGMDAHIGKPISPAALIGVLSQWSAENPDPLPEPLTS